MNEVALTFWDVADALSRAVPLSPRSVEQILGVDLAETSRTPGLVCWTAKGPDLADEVRLDAVELRAGASNPESGFLLVAVSGRCVSVEEVRGRYPEVRITGHPRGRSLEEKTVYSTDFDWGRLSFGFKESNRRCLASLTFHPKSIE